VKATPDDCFHLTVEIVREIHAEALKRFGGLEGVRDENLLAAAVLAPQSTFGGQSPHGDVIEIAAAYLFLSLPESSISRRQRADRHDGGHRVSATQRN
jgi:prophage maintenance system killer protein